LAITLLARVVYLAVDLLLVLGPELALALVRATRRPTA